MNKRWHHRRQRWVAPSDVFSPARYSVDVLQDDATPKTFVCAHHYAGTFPAKRFAVGLFGARALLVGVAVFSHPSNEAVLPKWTGSGAADSCELGRFVLLPDVGFNGETWFLARAFRLLAGETGLTRVVSFADPLAWRGVSGEVVKPEHWGTIYQASNAIYAGLATPRTQLVMPDGRPVSPRALSKLQRQEKGWRYCEQQLLDAGAPSRRLGEDPREWLTRVRLAPGFSSRRHQGNLTYVFGLTANARTTLRQKHRGGLCYPKRAA